MSLSRLEISNRNTRLISPLILKTGDRLGVIVQWFKLPNCSPVQIILWNAADVGAWALRSGSKSISRSSLIACNNSTPTPHAASTQEGDRVALSYSRQLWLYPRLNALPGTRHQCRASDVRGRDIRVLECLEPTEERSASFRIHDLVLCRHWHRRFFCLSV